MGKTHVRPQQTFSGANRETRLPSDSEITKITKPKQHPELRIIQTAVDYIGDGRSRDLGDENAFDWMLYLNALGAKNRGRGVARSLGSASLTIVSANEIGKMMSNRHGDRYKDPKQAKKLLEGLRGRLGQFFYESSVAAGERKAANVHEKLLTEPPEGILSVSFELEENVPASTEAAAVRAALRASALEADAIAYDDDDRREAQERILDIESELRRHSFGESSYDVPPQDMLQSVGKKAYAVDLSANDAFYEQRDAITTYLRGEEGLDVGLVNRNRTPHVTVFNLFPQYANTEFKLKESPQHPYAMTFAPIEAHMTGDNDILFE
jgi:hypothetical protein